jgi:hypothetical protein
LGDEVSGNLGASSAPCPIVSAVSTSASKGGVASLVSPRVSVAGSSGVRSEMLLPPIATRYIPETSFFGPLKKI